MAADLALIDTNVIVYALYADAPQHKAALEILTKTVDPDAGLCVAPQNLFELYAVVTNPRRVSVAFSIREAVELIEALLSRAGLTVLPVPPDVVLRCLELVRGSSVSGRRIFDAMLAATMHENGVRRIYTFNDADFSPFQGLHVLIPGIK